jgi:hypothetical protein
VIGVLRTRRPRRGPGRLYRRQYARYLRPLVRREPDTLVRELAADEAIAAAGTLLLTVPNTLGVEYNSHVIENILKYVAPELGWR